MGRWLGSVIVLSLTDRRGPDRTPHLATAYAHFGGHPRSQCMTSNRRFFITTNPSASRRWTMCAATMSAIKPPCGLKSWHRP
jgi:hypothetical protein